VAGQGLHCRSRKQALMSLKSMGSFTSQRDVVTLGVFAGSFAALLAFHMNNWVIVSIAILFTIYLSWGATAFLVGQYSFNGKTITAWVLPVGMAIFKVLACLGLVWLVGWSARHG
jgi:hypothetical protein